MTRAVDTTSGTGILTITKSDTTKFTPTKELYIGGTGNVAVTMLDGTTGIFMAVPAGATLRVRAVQVLETGTTATNIIAIY